MSSGKTKRDVQWTRQRLLMALLTMTLMGSWGCAMMMDSMVNPVFESDEDKQIRADMESLNKDRPLKYHKDERDLRWHALERGVEKDLQDLD